jgi:hypothetical protein
MLTLGISTSSGQFALVLGEEGRVVFDSTTCAFAPDAELVARLEEGLRVAGREVREIGRVLVDTGPGGTSRVRTGVAFGNALAYALGIGVCPVSSMELAGLDAWTRLRLPVIHAVKSIKGNADVGVADGEGARAMAYGEIATLLPRLTGGAGSDGGPGRFAVSGSRREEVLRWGEEAGVEMVDSGRAYGEARLLVEEEGRFMARALLFPGYALPVTEQTL